MIELVVVEISGQGDELSTQEEEIVEADSPIDRVAELFDDLELDLDLVEVEEEQR